jgi:protein gp37
LAFPNGFDLTYRPHKLEDAMRLKTPSLIFVNSMSDFFLADAEFNLEAGTLDARRDEVLDPMEQTLHQYQALTKRPEEMLRYSRRRKLPANFWAGVSVDVQHFASRTEVLQQVDTELRFISAEPMLSHLDLDLAGIDWVIGGGESGNHLYRPQICMKRGLVEYSRTTHLWTPRLDRYHWAQDMRDQRVAQSVQFFGKQWGGARPTSAGREIDGQTWSEFPRLPAVA